MSVLSRVPVGFCFHTFPLAPIVSSCIASFPAFVHLLTCSSQAFFSITPGAERLGWYEHKTPASLRIETADSMPSPLCHYSFPSTPSTLKLIVINLPRPASLVLGWWVPILIPSPTISAGPRV
ncbi:hypothetical protein BDQ12DRAFT_449462 [Crucibulum laeve]|uniref:Uncharacterized protein n=1 Tax=Crucibulum laeve TaxID=68775 RepID=A0A5C3LLG7_9AGAR|nr:hypothetical protein BDQ12DRAFT_449462 [Crucibulum laeve]